MAEIRDLETGDIGTFKKEATKIKEGGFLPRKNIEKYDSVIMKEPNNRSFFAC